MLQSKANQETTLTEISGGLQQSKMELVFQDKDSVEKAKEDMLQLDVKIFRPKAIVNMYTTPITNHAILMQ